MGVNLSQSFNVVRTQNAAAAGTTALNGTHVDMQGWDNVVFIYGVGALTATQVTGLKAQNGALANDSDQADITGAATPAMADGIVYVAGTLALDAETNVVHVGDAAAQTEYVLNAIKSVIETAGARVAWP